MDHHGEEVFFLFLFLPTPPSLFSFSLWSMNLLGKIDEAAKTWKRSKSPFGEQPAMLQAAAARCLRAERRRTRSEAAPTPARAAPATPLAALGSPPERPTLWPWSKQPRGGEKRPLIGLSVCPPARNTKLGPQVFSEEVGSLTTKQSKAGRR